MESLFKVFMKKGITDELSEILYSGQLASGKYCNQFEQLLSEFLGVQRVDLTNSYSTASSLVWEAIGIKSEDEVIASPMSCLASNQPVVMKGGKIVWADIDPTVGSLAPDSVKEAITPNTKAILHYHWGGYPGYIDEILAIGQEYGIPVVEDGIEAFGSSYKNKKLGATGADFSIFSFQPVRLPTSVDGGAVVCKNPDDAEKIALIKDYGIDRSEFRDTHGEISAYCDINLSGFGGAMSELNAFIGLQNLSETGRLIELQHIAAQNNDRLLEELVRGARPIGLLDTKPNYWIYTFLSDKRDELILEFRERGLSASKVHLRNDRYSVFGKFRGDLTGVNEFEQTSLSIPSGWWQNKEID